MLSKKDTFSLILKYSFARLTYLSLLFPLAPFHLKFFPTHFSFLFSFAAVATTLFPFLSLQETGEEEGKTFILFGAKYARTVC